MIVLNLQILTFKVENKRSSSSSIPDAEAVILERHLNDALNIFPRVVSCTTDMIGPPHPISNLRPIVWYRSETESVLERKLKDLQETTQEWNQRFWEFHNTSFANVSFSFFSL